ncbi:hypothetical protein ABTN03_19935, partial [Acinetobacter baumannii]
REEGKEDEAGGSIRNRIGLFGGGIAFPQSYRDGEGEVEPWVGFKRSIEQTDIMEAAFEESRFR